MRRSLTIKWIISLLAPTLIGVILIGFLANSATTREFDRLKFEESRENFITEVTGYYTESAGWQGVGAWYRRNNTQTPIPPGAPPLPRFALASTDGIVLVPQPPYQPGERVPPDELNTGTPIEIDGAIIAYVLDSGGSAELTPIEQAFLNRINQAILLGSTGAAAIAVTIGVILAQYFMRPLRELTAAIRQMNKGVLKQQLPVRTQDELGELTRSFNQMSADLDRSAQLRRQMTADIAHELRTPLTVITGYLEGLRDGTLKPTTARFETMHEEAVQLNRLIADLRTLSLADAGELKLTYQTVDLREFLDHIVSSFAHLADSSGIEISAQVEADLRPVEIDMDRMRQVLSNLVSNALRYTSDADEIILSAQRDSGSTVIISVRDTGEGIPPEKLTYIFDRFYRVSESRDASSGGTGLGLAIARSIVNAHGGKIAAHSTLGQGTEIRIQLSQQPLLPV